MFESRSQRDTPRGKFDPKTLHPDSLGLLCDARSRWEGFSSVGKICSEVLEADFGIDDPASAIGLDVAEFVLFCGVSKLKVFLVTKAAKLWKFRAGPNVSCKE